MGNDNLILCLSKWALRVWGLNPDFAAGAHCVASGESHNLSEPHLLPLKGEFKGANEGVGKAAGPESLIQSGYRHYQCYFIKEEER